MAFNFPDAPTAGQIFTDAPSGAQYVYTNGVWMQSSAAQIRLTAQARNRVCNPAMQISQEIGLDTTSNVTNTYIADQWVFYFVTAGVPVCAIRKETPPTDSNVPSWFFRLSSGATPDTSIAAGDFVAVRQPIEGTRIADFCWGTAQAKPAMLRFMARSTVAGTFCVALRNSPATHSFVKNCTIAANVWTQFVIPVPACTLGTWLIDNTLSAQLSFAAMAGSTFTGGVDNTWTAGSFIATPQISNWMSAASQLFEFTNVGLYLDDQATGAAPPWVMPDEAQELAACIRYYTKHLNLTASGIATAASQTIFFDTILSTPMRVSPAVNVSNTSNSNTAGVANSGTTATHLRLTCTAAAAGAFFSQNDTTLTARM